jgi:nuclear transport factor 2 (NTF2) superfamily protein
MTESRPPFPPFTLETAVQKVQAAEDAWHTRDPERVSLAYTVRFQHECREASINDLRIDESQRRYFVPRPESEYGAEFPLW